MEFTEMEKTAMKEYQQKFIDELNQENIVEVLHLQRAKVSGCICPICGSGSGRNGTGATVTKNRIVCYSNNCFSEHGEDVLGALRRINGGTIDSILKEHFGSRYDIAGVIKEIRGETKTTNNAPNNAPQRTTPNPRTLTQEIEKAHAALMQNETALSYLKGRGLTIDTITKHKLGYAEWGYNSILTGDNIQFQRGSYKQTLFKYIYPLIDANNNAYYFIAEITDRTQIDQYNPKYLNMKGTPRRIYNESCIQGNRGVIFVCEGIFDALSIEQLGGRAIAALGVGGKDRVKELESSYNTNNAYVIATDSDTAGQNAAEAWKKALNGIGRSCTIAPIPGAKDANELLQKDPAALESYIKQTTTEAMKDKARYEELLGIASRILEEKGAEPEGAGDLAGELIDREQEARDYPGRAAAAKIQGFINQISAESGLAPYSTGFKELDKLLDGGIYQGGLYFIGAISSLGKTTFALQIADNIAKAGHDVLIFSLEMDDRELMSKSISRYSFLKAKEWGTPEKAKTTRGIMTGSLYKYYDQTEKKLIMESIAAYGKTAEHIYISVGVGNIGVKEITERIKQHIRIIGSPPIVLIDYLQIIAPADIRATDKQNIDKEVLELKRLARDTNTAVIGISSFNRQSYTEPVSMASFKESGAIEYSSDVLIGLQYYGMDFISGEAEKSRNKRIRDIIDGYEARAREGQDEQIQVKILKNRNGRKGNCVLDFYPKFNYFEDTTKDIEELETIEENKVDRFQEGLDKMLDLFRATAGGNDMTQLEAMAQKAKMKPASLKAKLKEYSLYFRVDKNIVTLIEQGGEVL